MTFSPTISPTEFANDFNGTNLTATSAPTPLPDVEIINLPDYRSNDPVDGVFIVLVTLLILSMTLVCVSKLGKGGGIGGNARVEDEDAVARGVRVAFVDQEQDGDSV
jgi:hypothetical protein